LSELAIKLRNFLSKGNQHVNDIIMNNYKKYFFSMFLVLTALVAFGQGAPPATPIDGGLSLLLAAGGAYGLRKIVKNRKK
jgi:hypothetical protein